MLGCLEAILGSITVTKVLATAVIILIAYYVWPLLNDSLSHIPGPPVYPLIGSLHVYDPKKGLGPNDLAIVKKYGKVFKCYEGRIAIVMVSNADILRKVLVKNFANFVDRRKTHFRGIFKLSLFDVGGDEWRMKRHLMTPGFTTGKLKQMQPVIQKCVDRFCENIGKAVDAGEEIDAKIYTGMYTMDVIASTGFGIDLDSQADPNNPFLVNATKILSIDEKNPAFLVPAFAPFLIPLLELLGVRMSPKEPEEFFFRMMRPMIKERRENPSAFVDLLQLMVNSQDLAQEEETKEELKEQGQSSVDASRLNRGLTDDEILAGALTFFFAGYDTTANTLSFLIYLLSQNKEVQEQLYKSITSHMKGKSLSYESVSNIPYLEQCINETLRIYSPAQRVDRKASRDIDIDGLRIPAGTLVIVPIYALHNDPDIWPEPHKFDPSRFSAEAKATRDQFAFLPFGMGPRQCIGMRLALYEMRMLIVSLVQRFKFLPSKKPLEVDYKIFVRAKTGAWVRAERR